MAEIVGLIGHRMGGRPGAYLMHRLGMPVSDDTILRQLKRKNPASMQKDNIRVLGIDDWSWRHSSRYGTIMVDLERHSVVDVLQRRERQSMVARTSEYRGR
jgi:transposase